MRQHYLECAVARVTGESVRTIQQRGFGLLQLESRRQRRPPPAPGTTPVLQHNSPQPDPNGLGAATHV